MSLAQFLSILRARAPGALLVMLLCIALAVGVSLLLPKKYTARAALIVDVKSPDPIAGIVLTGMMSPGYMATQVDVIGSERVARRVVAMLKLGESREWRAAWQAAGVGGDFETWAIETLQRELDVRPSRESNVVNVEFTALDPASAARIANAFVQAYIDTSVDLRVEPARQYNSFFDERARQQRDALEAAQAKLSAYQQARGITASDERLDVENARLAELSSQLVALQAITAETSSRQAQARSAGDHLSDVLANPLVSGLKADLARQEARMQELGARLGERHPQVIEQQASIDELRRRLATETRRVTGSLGVNDNIARAREAEVRASLEAQRTRVLALKKQRDELAVLQRDVEQAQRAYDTISARAMQTSLESQTSQTNIAPLSLASPPPQPSSPRLLLNSVLGVFVGALLGIASALLRELVDRRVRSAQDLVQALDLPVLGVMLRPARGPLLARRQRLALHRRLLGPAARARGEPA
ncbi:MAG: chain length determinant protein EpsF [Piscinibacter sp.]|nr:chain length determinant protein EpsF [Piscinibacter sp.]